jgi:hypothetical protein
MAHMAATDAKAARTALEAAGRRRCRRRYHFSLVGTLMVTRRAVGARDNVKLTQSVWRFQMELS